MAGLIYLHKYSDNYIQLLEYNDIIFMMPGLKGLNPHEHAHKWVKDIVTRPNMSIKVGC